MTQQCIQTYKTRRLSIGRSTKNTNTGIIAQLTRILTTKHYNIAALFVDQATKFSYNHFQTSDSSKENLEIN